MKRFYFTKEEKLQLDAITAKRESLFYQDRLQLQEFNGIVSEICKRNSISADKKVNVDPAQGFIEIIEEVNNDEKKKNTNKRSQNGSKA